MSNATGLSTGLAIDVQSLSRSFRGKVALQDVSLKVPVGAVFGLVGLNGAGKTTLIRHLIGSMQAVHGSVQVLGMDPTRSPEKFLSRIGYMTEEDSLPTWMRVSDVVDFCRSVYPTWSDKYAKELFEMFSLSASTPLKSLSKGARARVALLAAIAHRPDLLVLDEPSSGLDPIARADILEAIIRTVSDEGRTVLFSSHLLEEIDRVCDHVAVIHEGQLLESLPMVDLGKRYQELHYQVESETSSKAVFPVEQIPNAFGLTSKGRECSILVDTNGNTDPASAASDSAIHGDGSTWQPIDSKPASLSRWFTARVSQPAVSQYIPFAGEAQHV